MPDAWPQRQLDALLAEGAIGYQHCEACAAPIHYPRVLCPRCGSTALRWERSAGAGTIYSASTVHPGQGEPYNVALVDLDEGIRVMTRAEGLPPDEVTIGMRVRLRVVAAEDGPSVAVAEPETERGGDGR